jgi:hypothetical protein
MQQIDDMTMRSFLEGVGRERSNLEFKPAFSWGTENGGDLWNEERVIRGVLGLHHHISGGVMIIGVDENEQHAPIITTGLTAGQLASFQDIERIRSNIDRFSSEPLKYEIGIGKWRNMNDEYVDLLVITVEQFAHYATMCTRDGRAPGVLRRGNVYVRPVKGQPRTECATPEDFRLLQDMATDNIQRNLETRGWTWQNRNDARAQRNADLEEEV